MLSEKSETVKVVVRCRPLSQKEINEQNECTVNVDMKAHTISVCNPSNPKDIKNFTYDNTYDWKATQELIFNETAKPILESVIQGYNGTIFAYGQTGTGKTYTMEGNDNDKDKGITPRSIYWIFDNIKNCVNQQFLVRASFVEIYNEEVRDLLAKNHKTKLPVREKDKVFFLEGVDVRECESPEKMLDIMKAGRVNRATGATKMNPGSSRSHSIFTIIVENSHVDEAGETHYRVGKLNLVDLAGSERQSKTESTGERFKEGTKINLSLTILGSVINKLVSANNQFIPYRDSKLTMLLQDSLGGNTKTVMIANVGPADYNYDETLNALWYASHAKKIKNKPRINEDPKDALLRQYQEEIELVKKKLLSMGKGALVNKISGTKGGVSAIDEERQMNQMYENLEKEKEDFKRQHEDDINNIKKQKNMAEEEKNNLIEKIKAEIEENKKQKDQSKQLLSKYSEMKKTVIKGKETEKKVKELEREISKQRVELEVKQREEARFKEELDNQARRNFDLKKKYESKQANIDDLDSKMTVLRQEIERVKRENKEMDQHYSNEEASYSESIRSMIIDNKRYDFFISRLIPKEEKEKIEKCIEYDEKENKHIINNKKAIRNNYSTNMETLKQMKMNRANSSKMNFLQEETINLQLEMPDSLCLRYKDEPVPEVLNDIEKILVDDDGDLLYFDPECNMVTSELTPAILKIPPQKIDSANTSSSTIGSMGVKPVIIKKSHK